MTEIFQPPMQKGKVPSFYELGEMPFQDLCRDLVAVQEEFVDCRVFGDRGQKQYGIDIRCERKSGSLEVAQSKCYKVFSDKDIVKASNEFLDYINYWLAQGVKKFILIVASRITSTQANNQIFIERQKFREFGIAYELWDAVRIRDILRDNPKLIFTHIAYPEFWAKEICGFSSEPALSGGASFGINLWNEPHSALIDMSSIINIEVSKQLEQNRVLWREGKGKPVINWIGEIKNSGDKWKALSGEIKASILRFEAGINIDYYENYRGANQLLEEAKEFDPNGFDLRVRAILAQHQSGPQTGLDLIGNAQDVNSICVRASILLQVDCPNEAIVLLEQVQDQNNAEAFRLLSLAYLNVKNLEKAVGAIEQAKRISDSWESVQIADAIISYFSTLSPAVIPEAVFVWPVPIELDLIKSTDDAIQALEKASAIFLKISQNEYKTEANKLSLLIWHAACLACDFRKQVEAEKLFGELLAKYPTDQRLISWIVARKFSVNLQKSRIELRKLRGKDSARTENIISTVMLDIHKKHTRNTLYFLESNKKIFIEEASEHLWEYWYIQTLIARKRLVEARKELEESVFQVELEPLKLLLLNRESVLTGKNQPFIDFILSSIDKGSHPLYLMELCRYYTSKKEWNRVSHYADKLVTEIQTSEALRLSSFALYNSGKFQECKTFIDKHKSLCFGNRLPDDLKLIYIQSKALSGEFPEALSDLRKFTENNPTKQNLSLLRDFYLRKGDQTGLRYVATLAKEQGNIQPDDLISFASSVLWASRELAEDLWRMAPTDQLSSEKLAEKMMLGFALGLDHEIKDIHNYLPKITGKKGAPLRHITKEEAIEIIQKQYQQRNELFRLYSDGEIPIHVLAKNVGFTLFAFYKNIIRYNSDPSTLARQKFPLYIRYGGKPSLTDFNEPESPFEIDLLALDVTSLLLLDHFSLLEVLEEEEKPIQIPSGTVLALVQMKDKLERYQPEMVHASKLVSEYLGEKKIKEIESKPIRQVGNNSESDRLLNFVSNLGEVEGYVIGYGPQLPIWNALNLNNYKETLKFTTCADVIKSLRTNGVITEAEKIIGIDRLGTDGQVTTNTLIPIGSDLFFLADTITQIAQTDILSQICDSCGIWIENNEVLNIRVSIKEERDRLTFASKLQGLIDRISRGLDEKKYIFLPLPKIDRNDDSAAKNDLLLHNLFENILSGQEPNSYSVVDDLYIQKQLHLKGVSLYGIYEIVWWLYKRGVIDEARYYDTLNEFRKADLRYIPISSDEILFHLNQAPVENNELIENAELKTIRSYLSSSLIYGKKMQIPSQPFDKTEMLGEFEFLISLIHNVSHAITKIWKENLPDDQKMIKSSWIIDNLFLDILTLCEIVGWRREPKDQLYLVALSLSEFFLNGLQFLNKDAINSSRSKYFQWVYYTICEPRFKATPGLLEITSEQVKKFLSSQIVDQAESEFNPIIRGLCEKLYRDLPDPIKTFLEKDKEFLQSIGVEITTVIQLADIMFPALTFWDKMAKILISGESAVIKAIEPKDDILFSPLISENNLGVTFTHPITKQNIKVESEDFYFLTTGNNDIWIDKNTSSFSELSREELQELVNRISLRSSPAEKLELVDMFRKASIGNYYKKLEEELAKSHTLNFDRMLPPSAQSLKQFFGFGNNEQKTMSVNELVDVAAKKLRTQHGLSSTIARLSAFPVEMPAFLLEEIRNLSKGERNSLFINLSNNLDTPMSRIHLIRIFIDYPGEEDRISELIKSFFSEVVDNEITAFSLLLSCIMDELEGLSGTENWSTGTKLLLSWGHSNHLFSILINSKVPFDWLSVVLKEKNSTLPLKYSFSKKPLIWEDIVYGGRIDCLSFKILSLCYSLNSYKSLSTELQNKLLAEIFPWEQNVLKPTHVLIKDRSIFSNQTGSFLGNELSKALSRLLKEEDDRLGILNSSSLRNLASLAIDWLPNLGSSSTGWQILFGIYQSQLLPDNLIKTFENNVSNFNFEDLARENLEIGVISLYFTACQAIHFSESNQKHLKSQLYALAEQGSKLLHETKSSEKLLINKDDVIALLLEISIRLSLLQANEKIIEEFGELVSNVVDHWKETKIIALRLLNRLIEEIPIPIAQKLGRILLELRSKE